MSSHQDGTLRMGFLRRGFRYVMLLVFIGISSGLLSHTIAFKFARNQHAIRLDELPAIVNAHKIHPETRDDIQTRDLTSALGDLVGSIEAGAAEAGQTVEGAVASLPPNTTTILDSLVSLITGGGNTTTIVDSLAPPAKFLEVGLASGALTGMGINMTVTTAGKSAAAPMPSATGLSALAENLGSGLTTTIFQSSAVKGLLTINMSSDRPGGLLGGSTGIVGQAVLAFAQGLGGGAVSGLKIAAVTNSNESFFNTSGANGIAGNFGQGLSQTILSNIQSPPLNSLLTSLGTVTGNINFAQVGTGFGAGIGQGAAIGLGLQSDVQDNSTVCGAEGIAQGFAKGLVSSFLGNGTVLKLASNLSSLMRVFGGASPNASATPSSNGTLSPDAGATAGFSFSNLNIAKVAEGFAVGLISGAGSTVSTLQIISADTTYFDDSVMGASTGCGRGLGSEGAKVVEAILNNGKSSTGTTAPANPKTTTNGAASTDPMAPADVSIPVIPASSADSAIPATMEAAPTTHKRFVRTLSSAAHFKSRKFVALKKRDALLPNATNLAGVLSNLNATTINPLINYGLSVIGCTGVGGFVGIFFGLIESKTLNISLADLAGSMMSASGTLKIAGQNVTLPDQTFVIKSSSNIYSLNPAQGVMTVMVNGVRVNRLIGLAVVHILFAIVVYFTIIPFILLLQSSQKIAFSVHRPGAPQPPQPKWQVLVLYSLLPLSIILFGVGIDLRGDARHFGTAHGLLGLLVFLQTLLAAATTQLLRSPTAKQNAPLVLVHKINIALMLILATATLFSGFTDLSALALCATSAIVESSVWMAIGWLLTMNLVAAEGLEVLKLWIWWTGRKMVGNQVPAVVQGKDFKIEKVPVGYSVYPDRDTAV